MRRELWKDGAYQIFDFNSQTITFGGKFESIQESILFIPSMEDMRELYENSKESGWKEEE